MGLWLFCDILQEKQEEWWLYVSDKRTHMLITAPVQILTLKDEEEVSVDPSQKGVLTTFMYWDLICAM